MFNFSKRGCFVANVGCSGTRFVLSFARFRGLHCYHISKRWCLSKEQWREVPGIPKYHVSSLGKVKNTHTGYQLFINYELFRTKKVRPSVSLFINPGYQKFLVNRLILSTFDPTPGHEKLHANHIDGDYTNNILSNLEWVTAKENMQHACRIGIANSNRSAVTIRNIENGELRNFESVGQAAQYINAHRSTVSEWCQKKALRKGYEFVYTDTRKYDAVISKDSEIWKLYHIGSRGWRYYVRNMARAKVIYNGGHQRLKKITEGRQYFTLSFECRHISLHRLVAKHFVPNPNNHPFVDHIDGDPKNNNASNWLIS